MYAFSWITRSKERVTLIADRIASYSTRAAKAGAARPTQSGGTNLVSHIVRLDYLLLPNLQLTAKAYIENVLDRKISNAALTGNPTLTRTQLDAILKF